MKAPSLEPVPSRFRVRLRVGGGDRSRVTIPLADERAALRRAEQLHDMARALVKAKQTAKARLVLTQAAEQRTEADVRSVAAVVAELRAAAGKPAKPRKIVPTFRELGEAWTSGELHELNPDQVPLKDTVVDDASRLDRYAYPVIGAKPVDQVTLDDCEEIMRRIPESAQRSRRHIAGTIARVFRMAVYPCRHIQAVTRSRPIELALPAEAIGVTKGRRVRGQKSFGASAGPGCSGASWRYYEWASTAENARHTPRHHRGASAGVEPFAWAHDAPRPRSATSVRQRRSDSHPNRPSRRCLRSPSGSNPRTASRRLGYSNNAELLH